MLSVATEALRLCGADELDIEKTFECGQCFRWNSCCGGAYEGVALGRHARLWYEDGGVYISAPESDRDMWREYFDLGLDYAAVSDGFRDGGYMDRCVDFGLGIRILRQDRWEALCSFIISQCNNIPRIKKIVETLCRCFGDAIETPDGVFYSFPPAERIALLDERDLAPLRCGYRAPYIISAAREVASGGLDFGELDRMSCTEAVRRVRGLYGVGAKVANCFILFGLHKMDAFPIDVWMKRALKEHFPKDFDPAVFGEYAGLAQQYIFYYARSGE